MIVQHIFCRSSYLSDISRNCKSLLWPKNKHVPLRSYKTSTRNNKPSMPSLQSTPFDTAGGGYIPPRNIGKAFVFTVTFSIGCFVGATIMEYENTRSMMIKKAKQSSFSWLQRRNFDNRQEGNFQNMKRSSIVQLQNFWDKLSHGEKIFIPICAINVIVFGLWRIPSLRSTMMTYFCSNPAGRAICWPMFLSTFSHYSAFHLFANMYVLQSFTNAAVLSLGKEQFLAVYLTAGVVASMTSVLYKTAISQAGLSLGASGAIMGILAYVCTQYPETQLSVLFLPMLTFSAGSAIKVLMGIDLAGCIMGWRFFDHAAHLGGAMFGVFWAFFGVQLWQKRLPLLSMYHDWRKTK